MPYDVTYYFNSQFALNLNTYLYIILQENLYKNNPTFPTCTYHTNQMHNCVMLENLKATKNIRTLLEENGYETLFLASNTESLLISINSKLEAV